MAIRFKITKKQYNALSDEMKAEYVAGDTDGEYVIDLVGGPEVEDVGPIKRSLENERKKSKDLKAKLDEANATIADAPDVEALTATHKEETGKLRKFAENSLVDGVAQTLASKISTAPTLLAPHIKSRLVADLDGDTPVTKVLDKDGKPSELTVDKLGEEFLANGEFKSIMIASKASGGGAPKNSTKPSGGGAPAGDQDDKFDASKASPKDLAARIKARKAAEAEGGGEHVEA